LGDFVFLRKGILRSYKGKNRKTGDFEQCAVDWFCFHTINFKLSQLKPFFSGG
jgi:hypothetical protein